MERLLQFQGPIINSNSSFYGEHLDLDSDCLGVTGVLKNQLNPERFKFEEQDEEEEEEEPNYCSSAASFENNNTPFLQMLLENVEAPAPPFFTLSEPNFQTLLRLEHLNRETTAVTAGIEKLESCVTEDVMEELHSSEETHPHRHRLPKSSSPIRERKKRKRQRPVKNKEEVESQRMTHIAVERNRRRQMNDHLNALRSLMPASYIHRGDQASIVGGAIDFVKELEQLLESLEAQKRTRVAEDSESKSKRVAGEGWPEAAEIEVAVIQDHVNLKVECERRSGQLARAIVGLEEELRLTVLHLNITSSPSRHTVLYSFNLKMEEDCGLGSVEEIAAAVQQIFSIVNGIGS